MSTRIIKNTLKKPNQDTLSNKASCNSQTNISKEDGKPPMHTSSSKRTNTHASYES
jgi:hypothetical protein